MKLMHKKLTLLAAFAATMLLFGCGGGSDPQVATQPPVVVPQREVNWTLKESVNLPSVNSVVKSTDIRAFSAIGNTLYKNQGSSFGTLGSSTSDYVFSTDIKAAGIYRDVDGVCYGLFRLQTGNSVLPYMGRTDSSCQSWAVYSFPVWPLSGSTSNTLHINLGQFSPFSREIRDYKFTAYDDSIGVKIALVGSQDAVTWFPQRTEAGAVQELLPANRSSDLPKNLSAVKTPNGVHIVYNTASSLIHLYSCDGLQFRVLDENPVYYQADKRAVLYFDKEANEVSVVSGGKRYSFVDQKFVCQK